MLRIALAAVLLSTAASGQAYERTEDGAGRRLAPPSEWDLARRREVVELGPQVLAHLGRCLPSAPVWFAFIVNGAGRITDFDSGMGYGTRGPGPAERRQLEAVERQLRADPRCNVWPEALRRRYISISSDGGTLSVEQVRDEAATIRPQ